MSAADPCLVLGVERGADPLTVRRAYRRLARRHHPDHGGSTARMRELNAAYTRLRDATWSRPGPGGRTFAVPSPRARSWLAGTRLGQWVVTGAAGLAIHALATWSTAPGDGSWALEALALVLALRLQASATPSGRAFAPTRDLRAAALLAFRAGGRIARRW